MSLDNLITQAQAEVTAAEALPDTDSEKPRKVAEAKGKVAALQQAKGAGYTRTQTDVDNAVQGRLPDAQSSAKEDERKRVAAALGIPPEQLTDEELKRLKQLREGQQSELERANTAAQTAQQQLETTQAERDRLKKQAETARANLEETLKRQAVERALLAEGVIHGTGKDEQGNERPSYLDGARRLTDLSQVSVEVEVDQSGNLNVKGEVQGAAEAAKKTKETYPAMFGEGSSGVVNPPTTPQDRRRNTNQGGPAYRPNLSVTGPRQANAGGQ